MTGLTIKITGDGEDLEVFFSVAKKRAAQLDLVIERVGVASGLEVEENGIHIKGDVSGDMVNVGSGTMQVSETKTEVRGDGARVRNKSVQVTQSMKNVKNATIIGHQLAMLSLAMKTSWRTA